MRVAWICVDSPIALTARREIDSLSARRPAAEVIQVEKGGEAIVGVMDPRVLTAPAFSKLGR
jgi:hypothetical protein